MTLSFYFFIENFDLISCFTFAFVHMLIRWRRKIFIRGYLTNESYIRQEFNLFISRTYVFPMISSFLKKNHDFESYYLRQIGPYSIYSFNILQMIARIYIKVRARVCLSRINFNFLELLPFVIKDL